VISPHVAALDAAFKTRMEEGGKALNEMDQHLLRSDEAERLRDNAIYSALDAEAWFDASKAEREAELVLTGSPLSAARGRIKKEAVDVTMPVGAARAAWMEAVKNADAWRRLARVCREQYWQMGRGR